MEPKKMKGIDVKNKTEAEKAAYWQQMLDEQEKSGLSQAEFTQQRGVSKTTFGKWKKRLSNPKKQIVKVVTQNKKKPGKVEEAPMRGKAKPSVTQVSRMSSAAPNTNNANYPIELKHESGFSLLIRGQTNEVLLKKVLRTLSEIAAQDH